MGSDKQAYQTAMEDADRTEYTTTGFAYPLERKLGKDLPQLLLKFYTQAEPALRRFQQLVANIVRRVNKDGEPVVSTIAPLKGVLRVCEKLVLRSEADAKIPWDVVRGQLRCSSMKQMSRIAQALMDIQSESSMRIVRVKNKFADDSKKNSWADLTFNVFFDEPAVCGCVTELQIVHERLIDIRERWNAHDAYEKDRFPAELQKLYDHPCLPYSVHKAGEDPGAATTQSQSNMSTEVDTTLTTSPTTQLGRSLPPPASDKNEGSMPGDEELMTAGRNVSGAALLEHAASSEQSAEGLMTAEPALCWTRRGQRIQPHLTDQPRNQRQLKRLCQMTIYQRIRHRRMSRPRR